MDDTGKKGGGGGEEESEAGSDSGESFKSEELPVEDACSHCGLPNHPELVCFHCQQPQNRGAGPLCCEAFRNICVPYTAPCCECEDVTSSPCLCSQILLCDSCDSGYHTACLRPPLMLIPDGEWFCPPCQHVSCEGPESQHLVSNCDIYTDVT